MAFAVLLAILMGIGQSGLRRVQAINATLNDITGRRSAKLQLSREAFKFSNRNSSTTMEIFLVQDRALIETLLAMRSENSKKISQLLAEMGSRCESEKEKHLLAEVNGTRQSYVESYLRALHLLVDEKKHDAAAAVMVNETLPSLVKYHAALDQFVEFQKDQLDVAVKQAQADYIKTHRLASLLTLLSVAVALGIAVFTTRQAQQSLRQDTAARESVEFELQRSEERMRMAMEAAKIGFWDLDVIKDEHVWSNTCKALLGVPSDSPANFQLLMNAVHPDDWKMMRAEIDGAIQKKRDYVCEFRVVWPDNSVHWRTSSGHAFYDDTGHVIRMSGITMDIDERKYAEERLHLQAAALGAAANAIVITDSHGAIVWVNDAFTTMTGYSREEVLGKNARVLKSGEQPQSYYANLWSTISSGKVWKGEIVNRRKDGTAYTEEMTITPVTPDVHNPANRYFVAIKQNITERKRAEEMLQNSANKYRVLFEDSADANWLMDEKGFLDCNSAALQMFGYSAGAEMMHPANISPPNQADGTPSQVASERKIATALLNGKERFEWLHQRKNGNVFPAEVCLTALTLSGRPTLLATVRDISDRKEVEKELRLTQFSVEHASDAIFWIEPLGRVVYVNEAACRSLGYSREELRSLSIPDIAPLFPKEAWKAFWQEIKMRGSMSLETQHRTKQGTVFPVEITANYQEFDGREYAFVFVHDITERKVAEGRIQFLAYSDALTALPNRRLLQDRLTQALASARRQKNRVALLFLDLDRFKNINDSLGHSVGDLLLQEVAGRLTTWGREQDTVARVGGDEFLIVLTGLKDVTDAAVAAERLMDAMIGEYSIQGHALNITCSLGISIFPEHGTDSETLIKNADTAMYSAKESGRNGFRFFTEDVDAQAVERLTLENSLQLALDKKELFLVYQPQMDIVSGEIIGLEALLRWQHPELGLVPPDKFIRIAENCGLIVPIGEWVLRTVCSQARKWQEDGLPPVRVAVNVSAVQFRRQGFSEQVRRVLHETGLAPQYLELELTESLLLANAEVTLSVIQELRAMGLALAIDDFGTGYSSFSYLKQFRVSRLKIDRSFIRDVAANPDDAAIAAAIISMAKSLRLKVIAEGVENEEQMSFLRAHQCDEIQGYYFSEPLAVDKVADKLRGDHPEAHVQGQASGRQS